MRKVREHCTGGRRRDDRRRATTDQTNDGERDRRANIEGRENMQGRGTEAEMAASKKTMAQRFKFESRIHDPAKSM